MAPETTIGFSTWTLTITTSATAAGGTGEFHYSGNVGHIEPETETERLVREFGEELQRYLDSFAIWSAMSRANRRDQFLGRRLRSTFKERARSRQRTCSVASRWMVTP